MIVCLNGALAERPALDITDRGFTLGDGVFETIAVYRGVPRRLPAHLARLRAGLAVLQIAVGRSDADLEQMIAATLAANKLTDGVLRLTVSRGPGVRGLVPPAEVNPTIVIAASPPPPAPSPVRVVVAKETRRNEFSPLARIKSLNYLDNVLARQEAATRGADDALMLNTAGRVACASAANLFLLVGGRLVTPALADGALAGVARAEAIRLARAEEEQVTLDMLARASEAFLTNALGVRPVIAIDATPVGDGEPGLITQLVALRL